MMTIKPSNVFDNYEDAREYLKKAGGTHEIVMWRSKDGIRWSVIRKQTTNWRNLPVRRVTLPGEGDDMMAKRIKVGNRYVETDYGPGVNDAGEAMNTSKPTEAEVKPKQKRRGMTIAETVAEAERIAELMRRDPDLQGPE